MPATAIAPATAARRTRAGRWWWVGALLVGAAAAQAADDAARWQALWARLPPLPAQAADAARAIAVRAVRSEGLGHAQLRVDIGDERLKALQRDIDALFDVTAQAHAAQVRRAMDAVDKDPKLAELARKMDETWKPDPARPDAMPSLEQLRQLDREVNRVLGPMPTPASAAQERAAKSEIAAYRMELQRATPRAGQFMQRLADQQRNYLRQHAATDRDAVAQRAAGAEAALLARTVVARHQALAQQQLADANAIHEEARAVLGTRVQRFIELAQAAEQRGVPVPQRHEAYAAIKSYLELLLSMQRETLLDVGFWAGLRAAVQPAALYEHALAPGFDLRANGEPLLGTPYYPAGRAIVLDRPPGIR